MTKNRRRLHPAFLFVAVLFLLCGATQGGTIIDPQMKMLEDELSSAILQGTQFNPNSTGGGVFGFFNATGKTITEITFENVDPTEYQPDDRRVGIRVQPGQLQSVLSVLPDRLCGVQRPDDDCVLGDHPAADGPPGHPTPPVGLPLHPGRAGLHRDRTLRGQSERQLQPERSERRLVVDHQPAALPAGSTDIHGDRDSDPLRGDSDLDRHSGARHVRTGRRGTGGTGRQ